MNNPKYKHCDFPNVSNTRMTHGMDFFNSAYQTSAADLFTVLMSEAETALQNHNWEYGKEYTTDHIVQIACVFAKHFLNKEHCFNLGYQLNQIPSEDYEDWKIRRAEYLKDLETQDNQSKNLALSVNTAFADDKRIADLLLRNKIYSISDLVSYTYSDLAGKPKFGEQTMQKIVNKLAWYQLKLKVNK